jgi:hypothetical protein
LNYQARHRVIRACGEFVFEKRNLTGFRKTNSTAGVFWHFDYFDFFKFAEV